MRSKGVLAVGERNVLAGTEATLIKPEKGCGGRFDFILFILFFFPFFLFFSFFFHFKTPVTRRSVYGRGRKRKEEEE